MDGCLIKLMSALIEGINAMPVNMIRHIPFAFYVDEHITLMACRFTALEGVLGKSERGGGGEGGSPRYVSTAARWLFLEEN